MERKLLSLPSFFVLLLIAGIAFLAAPVEDVQAALTGTPTVLRSGNGDVGRGDNVVFRITFTNAVKVAGETTSGEPNAWTTTEGFGIEDLDVITTTSTSSSTRRPTAAEFKKADATNTAGSGLLFDVTIAAPLDQMGNIAVGLKTGVADTVAFTELADANMAWATTAAITGTAVNYDTRDQDAPTASFTAGVNLSGEGTAFTAVGGEGDADRFQIEITVADTVGLATSGDGVFAPTADVKLTTTLANPPATAPATDPSTFISWPKATATATSATHVLVIDPANGATMVKVEVKADSVIDAATNKIGKTEATVTISPRPKVTITSDATPSQEEGTITVTFGISINPGTTGDLDLQDKDITATNATKGSLKRLIATPPEGGNVAFYEMVITPNYTNASVVVTVAADAVKAAGAGANDPGNVEKSLPITVKVPDTDTTTTEPTGTTGSPLPPGKRGFSFILPAMAAPTAADGSDRFVVIAKASNNSTDNGLSVPSARFVDINDVDAEGKAVWQDLADFLAYDGGTIELIGPAGTEKGDLVISEMMWGRDDGLTDTTKSQWIELYNATTTKGTATGAIASGTWTIEFHAGTGPLQANPLQSDSFSNRELGNAHWDIPNVAGGKYGQGGRTKLTPGTAGTLRDLVSMRRKIDYAKVEKTDHKATEAENRPEQLKGIPDGALAGSWEASTSRVNMSGNRKGTPGARHVVVVGTSGISKSVVFNEIANRSDKKFDWIELYNPGGSDVKINNWVLSKVTDVDKDDKLFKFESDENIVVPAKGFLLVVNEDPSETALAAGKNVDNPNSNANNYPTEIYINSGLDIPKEKYLLVLRTEEKLKSHEKIVDIAGHLGDLSLVHTGNATELWPLKAWKRIKNDDLLENNDKTWVRDKGKDLYHGDAWKSDGGFTGLGIDRNPDSDEGPTSGTPGFDNGAVKDKVKDLTASDPVVISEIMFGTGGTGNRRNPQWIELYNPSKTQAVKLLNWRLEVQNTTIDPTENLNVEDNYTLILPDKRIQPNQTLLIVSASAREATRDRFPSDRIINIWSTRTLRETVEMASARDAILSSVAFHIKLSDPEKQVVDEVGNIVRARDTRDWDLPGGNLDEGGRASMMRRKGTFGDGTEADAWISAAVVDPQQKVGINELYYGDESDLGTPGYRAGGPLPVQLSSFYSKRNDAGAVVITWSTESELDNAGFNILRSQSRTGEFVRINAQLIPGAGTTGEKSAYTWTDTSAKPNVLYFYQIEDVSLAGDHRTLRTTRLRGYIGAAGKAATTWGDLKSRE